MRRYPQLMPTHQITSRSNPLIRELARLHKSRDRRATGRFLIEGAREVDRASAAGVSIERLLLVPEWLSGPRRDLAERLGERIEVTELGESAFRALSRRQGPDGILAVARRPERDLTDLDLSSTSMILVAEAIEKPGNLGAMLRTADGSGADAVVVADPVSDLENPNVIRASQGSVFSVPAAVSSTRDAIDFLAANDVRLIAITPEGSDAIWDVDLTGPVAIAVGSERSGLSEAMRDAGIGARIPMAGSADTFNASVATALALYEAVRQRA